MRSSLALASCLALGIAASGAQAQDDIVVPLEDIPREQTIILENPQGTLPVPDNFNIWVPGVYPSNGLQQLAMDTLWFIDPESGLDGPVYNSLASGPPEYNDDFTEMTVNLREGIYWSDGVEFTADDVVFTVEHQMANPGTIWGPRFNTGVESVEAVDPYTVHFRLKGPNSRFHTTFAVRWNACWIMPKHVFETVDDIMSYRFNPPLSIGPYVLHSFDQNGSWYMWERREDWDRTTIAPYGEPTPRYAVYQDGGPADRRVIALQNGDLDVIHDISPEGMFSLAETTPTARGWFPGFPYAHPDPTLPSVLFNHQNPLFQDRQVRWALALLIDIRAVSMASYRGAATISAIAIPPTGTHPDDYHGPMQDWLASFELDTGTRTINPYNPDAGADIAEQLRPSMGEAIPTDPAAIAKAFGMGWWRQDPEAAAELLQSAGFTQDGDEWLTPDGEPFRIRLMVEGDTRPVMTRAGTMIAQNWRQFGIDAEIVTVGPEIFNRLRLGDYDVGMGWSIETWGGHPDLSFFLESWHSGYIVQPGESQPPRNWQRWQHPELDRIIEAVRGIGFDDPQGVDLGREFVELMVEEMPIIPIMSYNVFSVVNERYWTGFPTSENPYANPVSNWANTRYIFPMLEPVQP
ncbi:MAG: ABC transporter substrate-binding protein [Alphaproteobacteria bacterium]